MPTLSPVMTRLVAAIQELSQARSVERVRDIVRHAARELTGADGATFVLREHGQCHYVDEDAIAPLWKGQRFPMTSCISGWSMLHGKPVVIEDVFQDNRIPHDAYRKTFVQSLVMVPIRPANPVGAIGTYWSAKRRASQAEVEVLQALANTTAVALENVAVYAELESRVRQRTRQLEQANVELESFAASVSHDLRAPLTVIGGSAEILQLLNEARLDEKSRTLLGNIPKQVQRMSQLIEDLLRLAKIRQAELRLEPVDLAALARELAQALAAADAGREVRFAAANMPPVMGDRALLRIALENLLANGWKYTRQADRPAVTFGCRAESEAAVFFVQDNGAGFRSEDVGRLFRPFQRLHSASEFPGTGVGLSIVAGIVEKHGGKIWAEGEPGRGATFCFTLPEPNKA
jgi:signal transduction histidine kinase